MFNAKTLQSCCFPDGAIAPGGALLYLLRQSDRSGGGDVGIKMVSVTVTEDGKTLTDEEQMRLIAAKARTIENVKLTDEQKALVYAGRWHGDRVTMIGDYDTGGLYDALHKLPRWTELDYEEFAKEFAEMIVEPSISADRDMKTAQDRVSENADEHGGDQPTAIYKTILLDNDGGFDAITTDESGTRTERFDRPQ